MNIINDNQTNKGQLGLANVGNSCFLNSTVQCLAGTSKLREYFSETTKTKDGKIMYKFEKDLQSVKSIKNNKTDQKKKLTRYWYTLLKNLWSQNNDRIDPIPFYKQLAIVANESKKELSFNGTQNDFQEFLILLLEALHDSLSRETNMTVIGNDKTDMDRIDRIAYENYILNFEKDYSVLVELFTGQIHTKTTGIDCGHSSEICDPIQFFPIVVPAGTEPVDIEILLKEYTSEIVFNGDNKWYCDECCKNVDAISKISIWKLPPYLIISLGRYQYVPNLHKRNTTIKYPLENLDMNPYYCGFESNSLKYNLYAVGIHLGNPYSGHYIALRKNEDGNWYNFNDEHVRKISESSVVTSGAYCLFYQRSDL